jgi:HemY protein
MLAATIAGALLMFLVALWREGRHAMREWRVHREMRAAQRSVEATAQARSLALAGEFSRARALLKRATQKRSAEVADIIDYADTFMLEGDAAQARVILEEGQRTFGNDPILLYALANACVASGDARTAITTLERALAIHPRSPRLLALLRDQLFAVEDWQRATAIQARIVELNPANEVESNRMLGARYEAALRAAETERGALLKTLCNQAPGFTPATVERARSLARAGEQRRALKLLERALAPKPRSVLLDLYEEIARTEDVSRVNKLYSKLVALHPQAVDLKLRAAGALISRHRLDEAAALLSSCSSNGSAPAAQMLWAQLHDARNQPDLAHAAYREAAAGGYLAKPRFACEKCGTMSESWRARCDNCDTWGFVEDLHQ